MKDVFAEGERWVICILNTQFKLKVQCKNKVLTINFRLQCPAHTHTHTDEVHALTHTQTPI